MVFVSATEIILTKPPQNNSPATHIRFLAFCSRFVGRLFYYDQANIFFITTLAFSFDIKFFQFMRGECEIGQNYLPDRHILTLNNLPKVKGIEVGFGICGQAAPDPPPHLWVALYNDDCNVGYIATCMLVRSHGWRNMFFSNMDYRRLATLSWKLSDRHLSLCGSLPRTYVKGVDLGGSRKNATWGSATNS